MSKRTLSIASAALFATLVVATPALADGGAPQVTICHGSAGAYELITVDENALNGHFNGTDSAHGWKNLPDKFPEANGTCVADGGGDF